MVYIFLFLHDVYSTFTRANSMHVVAAFKFTVKSSFWSFLAHKELF